MFTNEILNKECTACPSELCLIRKDVAEASAQLGFEQQDIDSIVLAIDEACTNIIRYAYKDCQDGKITLQILTDGKQAIFRLHDFAEKVSKDCLKLKDCDPLTPGGLGVALIKKIMDKVGFIDTDKCQGNILELKKNLPLERQ